MLWPVVRCSSPQRSHLLGGVARARHGLREPVELAQVLAGQLELERAEVLLEALDALGARAGDHLVAARQHPRQRHLARRGVVARSHRLDLLDQLEVRLQVLALEAREAPRPARVALLQVLDRADLAGEEAAAQRRVGDEAEAEKAETLRGPGYRGCDVGW